MPIFVILGKMTEEGIRAIKTLEDRQKAAAKIVDDAGGKILGLYYTIW